VSSPVTVSAVGKDGQSVLPDLQGASPAGGMVRSGSVPHTTLLPGQVIRWLGSWMVVLTVCHYGVQGYSWTELVGPDGIVYRRSLYAGESVEVREDVRIDPNTLWKLPLRVTVGKAG
jgi:hypothetical protein